MEKRKICTICDKSYSNGKALGGHMRSHFAMLPLPPKSPPPNPAPVSSPPSSLTNPTLPKNDRPSEPQADDPAERKFVATTRRRSERRRRTTAPVVLAAAAAVAERRRRRRSSSSAAADAAVALSDEEAARFLMELSRDKWAPETERAPEEEEEAVITIRSSPQRFRCETCNKEFGSHQALGGHKANHKRMKSHCKKALSGLDQDEDEEEDEDKDEDEDGGENGDGDGVEEEFAVAAEEEEEEEEEEEKTRAFQCEFCFKVFGSGQALGGHKKAHFSTHLPRNALSPKFGGTLVIDLNFPPPQPNGDDDDDDQEVHQVQVISHKGFSTLISN